MKIYQHKNYILEDPFLDFMNINGKNLGHKRDDEYSSFDKELLLDNYIKSNKKMFIELIRNDIGIDFKEYETSIGKVDIIMKTEILFKYFKNGCDFRGNNFSIMTVEYCNLNLNKKSEICNYPRQQKYYKYKNWMLKRECIKNNIKIDYSFILARRYGNIDSYNMLFENKSEYEDLEEQIKLHLSLLHEHKYLLGKNIFPNMKNTNDFPWHNAKKKIACRLKEITLIKGLNNRIRDEYVKKKIYDYSSLDIDCINNIISLKYDKINVDIPLGENCLFIDFEVLTSIYDDFSSFPKSNKDVIIFNIGCGYEKKHEFYFKSYIAHKIEHEKVILQEFIDFINNIQEKSCTFFHWTHVEKSLFTKKIKQYNLIINKDIVWFDLHKFFINHNILVKDCYTYKLKHVARSLHKNNLIKSEWNTTFSDGLGAMTGYIKYLSTQNKKIIDSIIYYNMIDCKVLWEIRNLFIN